MTGSCVDCGATRTNLHSHHLVPRSEGGGNDPANLVGLCANCHEDRHGGAVGGRLRGKNKNSVEAREKRRLAALARWADPETRARMTAALHSPMAKARRAAGIARWRSEPANAEREAAIHREVARRPERNEKIAATLREKGLRPPLQTPEELASHLELARPLAQTPEAKAKRAASLAAVGGNSGAMVAKWADPAFRSRMSAADSEAQKRRWSKVERPEPPLKRPRGEAMREWWANPENRARATAKMQGSSDHAKRAISQQARRAREAAQKEPAAS